MEYCEQWNFHREICGLERVNVFDIGLYRGGASGSVLALVMRNLESLVRDFGACGAAFLCRSEKIFGSKISHCMPFFAPQNPGPLRKADLCVSGALECRNTAPVCLDPLSARAAS